MVHTSAIVVGDKDSPVVIISGYNNTAMQYNRKGTTVNKAIEDRKDMLKRWKELPPSARDHLTWEQFKRHEQFHQMAAGTPNKGGRMNS